MSDDFFIFLFRTYHDIKYFERYQASSEKCSAVISALLAIGSCSGIGALCFSPKWQAISAFFIAAMQILQAIYPYFFNFSKRIIPLKNTIQDYTRTYRKMERDWMLIQQGKKENIDDLLFSYKIEIDQIYDRFLGDISLPENEKFLKYADNAAKREFSYNYNLKFERIMDNEQNTEAIT